MSLLQQNFFQTKPYIDLKYFSLWTNYYWMALQLFYKNIFDQTAFGESYHRDHRFQLSLFEIIK